MALCLILSHFLRQTNCQGFIVSCHISVTSQRLIVYWFDHVTKCYQIDSLRTLKWRSDSRDNRLSMCVCVYERSCIDVCVCACFDLHLVVTVCECLCLCCHGTALFVYVCVCVRMTLSWVLLCAEYCIALCCVCVSVCVVLWLSGHRCFQPSLPAVLNHLYMQLSCSSTSSYGPSAQRMVFSLLLVLKVGNSHLWSRSCESEGLKVVPLI